jgi:hypothetical protein
MKAEALEQLGTKMEAQFKDAKAQGFDALVPSGFARTSADEFESEVAKTDPRPDAGAPAH